MSEIVKKIKTSVGKSGFALIVSNDYEEVIDLETLKGTHVDGELLEKTFQDLNFITHLMKNANKGELIKIIYEVTSHCKPSQEILDSYKCMVVVFSGHGCKDGYIYMQDKQQVHIGEEIIEPFLPESCKQLGAVPKLFFIDACRGESKMGHVPVARGSESKGATNSLISFVPAAGNFLVAYSTLADYKSFEDSTTGGMWMSLVAKHISTNEVDSIESVLVDVREELMDTYKTERDASNIQQPETINRLNKRVYLKGSGPKKPAVFPSTQPNESSQSMQTPGPVVSSQVQAQAMCSPLVSSTSELPTDSSQSQDPGFETCFQPFEDSVPLSNPPISQYPTQSQYSATNPETPYTANTSTDGVLHGNQQVPQPTSTMGPSPEVHMTPIPENYYQQQIWQYSITCCPKLAEYEDTPLLNHQYNHTYYRSTVNLKVIRKDGTSIPVTGDSHEYFVTVQTAREMAAKDACDMIQTIEQQQHFTAQQTQHLAAAPPPPSITVPMTTPKATPTGYDNSVQTTHNEGTPSKSQITRTVSVDVSPPKGSARAKFNEFLQKHGTKPQYSFISESSNGQQRYQCSIKYTLPGQPTRRCTSSGYYASKADAKEQAARKILEDERKGISSTPSVSSRSSATEDKLWKSKLKEYFDKKGQQLVVLEYSTSACLQGFRSVVRGPEFGEVEGDVRKSKKEAEQSAAQKAWEKLTIV